MRRELPCDNRSQVYTSITNTESCKSESMEIPQQGSSKSIMNTGVSASQSEAVVRRSYPHRYLHNKPACFEAALQQPASDVRAAVVSARSASGPCMAGRGLEVPDLHTDGPRVMLLKWLQAGVPTSHLSMQKLVCRQQRVVWSSKRGISMIFQVRRPVPNAH